MEAPSRKKSAKTPLASGDRPELQPAREQDARQRPLGADRRADAEPGYLSRPRTRCPPSPGGTRP